MASTIRGGFNSRAFSCRGWGDSTLKPSGENPLPTNPSLNPLLVPYYRYAFKESCSPYSTDPLRATRAYLRARQDSSLYPRVGRSLKLSERSI